MYLNRELIGYKVFRWVPNMSNWLLLCKSFKENTRLLLIYTEGVTSFYTVTAFNKRSLLFYDIIKYFLQGLVIFICLLCPFL